MMTWYLYLLVSKNIKYLNYSYVGITTDINRRLKQHNGLLTGGAKSTCSKRPYEVKYYIDNIDNKSIASKLEYKVKQQHGYINRFEYMKKIKENNNIDI
jgi:predicted GIY-YIG superfamily endonuclease